jgi:hypothetical protein
MNTGVSGQKVMKEEIALREGRNVWMKRVVCRSWKRGDGMALKLWVQFTDF